MEPFLLPEMPEANRLVRQYSYLEFYPIRREMPALWQAHFVAISNRGVSNGGFICINCNLSRHFIMFIAHGPAMAEPRLWRGVVGGIPPGR